MIPILCLLALLFAYPHDAEALEPLLIWDVKAAHAIDRSDWPRIINAPDILLLGEIHDNPEHHTMRAQLLKELTPRKRTVIAEHLPAGDSFMLETPLLEHLSAHGFEPKAWDWPIHEPLYDVIASLGLPLKGANPPRASLTAAYRNTPELAHTLSQVPVLSVEARQRLVEDLRDGHCGQLEASQVDPMIRVQRFKDLSFAQALLENRPSVLIAGDGHVRRDYGVAQILTGTHPEISVLSIGFLEGVELPDRQDIEGLYDIVVLTGAPQREDPCRDFHFKKN